MLPSPIPPSRSQVSLAPCFYESHAMASFDPDALNLHQQPACHVGLSLTSNAAFSLLPTILAFRLPLAISLIMFFLLSLFPLLQMSLNLYIDKDESIRNIHSLTVKLNWKQLSEPPSLSDHQHTMQRPPPHFPCNTSDYAGACQSSNANSAWFLQCLILLSSALVTVFVNL